MVAAQVDQPVPAGPMRASAGTRTSIEVDAVLRVGRDRHLLRERDARRVARYEEQIDVGGTRAGAREHDEHVGRAGEADVALGAGEEEPVAVRVRVELHAARPEAAVRLEPGRRKDRGTGRDLRAATPAAARCSAARSSTPPHNTELTKCGDGASARPNSS